MSHQKRRTAFASVLIVSAGYPARPAYMLCGKSNNDKTKKKQTERMRTISDRHTHTINARIDCSLVLSCMYGMEQKELNN